MLKRQVISDQILVSSRKNYPLFFSLLQFLFENLLGLPLRFGIILRFSRRFPRISRTEIKFRRTFSKSRGKKNKFRGT